MLAKKIILILFSVMLAVLLMTSSVSAGQLNAGLSTSFTYQGKLMDGGAPANGTYDFQFSLYNALSGGTLVGSTVSLGDVTVTSGLFTVQLDFGNVFNGAALFLQIAVRPGASVGAYTTLTPRQLLSAAPKALYALQAGNADTLDNQPGSYYQNAGNLNAGTLGNSFFDAYANLVAKGYLGNAAGDLALNNGSLQATLNADLLDGLHAASFALSGHNHWGASWSGSGTGLTLSGGTIGLSGDGSSYGVTGNSTNIGVLGASSSGTGVYGASTSGFGVDGASSTSSGVYGTGTTGVYGVGTINGIYGQSDSTDGYGMYGYASATSGTNQGVYGKTNSAGGTGTVGYNASTTGGFGILGATDGTSGTGVMGVANATSGGSIGVMGSDASTGGIGVYGYNTASSGATKGVAGRSDSTTGFGVLGYAAATSGWANGVFGQTASTDGNGVYGYASAFSGLANGVVGKSDSTSGTGVYGDAHATSGSTYGMLGQSESNNGTGVKGWASATSGSTYGVYGESDSPAGSGVVADNSSASGTALTIQQGAIRVAGAGVDTSTTVFIQATNDFNLCNMYTVNDATVIDNPLTNGDPNAILFITQSSTYISGNIAVLYDASNKCGYGQRWFIEDSYGIPDGIRFNVLVVKP